jgi:16S rRNA (cytidine1402-2'-O)-methyltransferase
LNYLNDADVAIVSEAGMPGMSDPGYDLIVAAQEKSIPVVPIPGPSAVITALVVSGLPADRFTYIGFLPNKTKARLELLKSVASESGTIVAFEAPHRLKASLEDIQQALGDRQIAVCREITKLHEEIFRGTVSAAIEHFTEPRGEFTLVIEGKPESQPQLTADIEKQLHYRYLSGMPAKKAIAEMAQETGLSRKELYRTWLKLARTWDVNKDVSTERS